MLGGFIPFSTGTRGCIGHNVSIMIQSVCVATLTYHYNFALPNETWELDYEEWFNLWPLRLPLRLCDEIPSLFTRALLYRLRHEHDSQQKKVKEIK